MLGIQLGVSSSPPIPASSTLDVFLADLWFTASLFCGLYVLWRVAAKSGSRNVFNLRDVGLVYGFQLIVLFTGVLRLVIGVAALVGGTPS